jgi:hypothetical protein
MDIDSKFRTNYRKIIRASFDDRGSISVLVGGLFLITIALLMIMTNIAEVAIAKRSLTQATESAAQRGVGNLDKDAYYQGEFDAITMAANLLRIGADDPGIPIDCAAAEADVLEGLRDWVSGDRSLTRVELSNIRIDQLTCDGFGIELTMRAQVTLPLVLPFIGAQTFEITSRVGTTNIRQEGFYLFGMRIF